MSRKRPNYNAQRTGANGRAILLPIDEDSLMTLVQDGQTCGVLEARLAFASVAQILNQHVGKLAGHHRVYPNMMSPQASGRMSVSDPPLANFTADTRYGPDGIRDCICPDPGEKWVCFDWEAVEARKIGHYCQDPVDKEAFDRKYDIHTVTAQRMFRWPEFDFEPTKKALFKAPAGLEWCEQVGRVIHAGQCRLVGHAGCTIHPYGEDHRYRRLAKNCRYCLQYAKSEKAMGRYVIEMRMRAEELYRFGAMYLASKPWLTRWKAQTWHQVAVTLISRTWAGRARKFPKWKSAAMREKVEKEGLNHIIQGGVADMLKVVLAGVRALFRRLRVAGRLVYQSHDGAKWAVPREIDLGLGVQEVVEQEWVIDGRPIRYPASYKTVYAPGEEP